MFRYSKAICRGIPKSLVEEAQRIEESESPISYENAEKQHLKYIETLKQLGLEVVVLKAEESMPDCVYIEDPAVVWDGMALITNPGHPKRKAETFAVKKALEDLGISTTVMEAPAELDGGDVLFTGKEIFVGNSTRTNMKGIEALGNAFPQFPVHSIDILNETLHLKSMLSMVSDDAIAFGPSASAKLAMDQIKMKSKFKYNFLIVSSDAAANCLWINGTLVHRAVSEFPNIIDDFSSLRCPKLELSNSELCKADGALTCCSLLIA